MMEKLKQSPIITTKKGSSNVDDDDDNEMNDITTTEFDEKGIESLDEMIDSKLKVGYFHYRLLLVCGLAWMADSMEFSLLSFLSICVGIDWNLSSSQTALISSVVFIGELLGSLCWGKIADSYGRRSSFMFGCSIIVIFGFMSAFATSFVVLCLCRSFVGFGVGGLFVISDLLAEFMPLSHRGRYLVYVEYFWTIGSLFVAGLAWVLLSVSGWRILTFITVIPVTISLFLAYFYLPESPRWLISQRKVGEAERVILDIAACNNVIISPFSLSCDSGNRNVQISESHWKHLISKPMLKITLPLILIWASFGFTYNGIILFVAKVFSNNSTIGGSCSFDYSAITINAASELLGTLLATLLIDTWGRNRTQTYIYLAAAISILIISLSSSQYILLACAFIARSTLMGASNATWVITPELYPTHIRATGHSVCNSMARITAFFVPFLIDSPANNQQICLVLAIVVMIATIASSTLPETRNKLLDKNSNESIIESNEFQYNKL